MNNSLHNLLIWSFGTSDLYLNWEKIDIKNFLNETQKIADNFDNYKDKISFPMFDNFVKQYLENKEEKTIVKWVFTNQNPSYSWDTINLQKIFNQYLSYKYKKQILFARNHIILSEPRQVEIIIEEIKNNFAYSVDEEKFTKIMINITGGTKPIVVWLTLASLEYFSLNKTEFYYWIEKVWKTLFLDVDFKNTIYNKQIKKITQTGDFYLIKKFIEDNNLVDSYEDIYNASLYGVNRLLCNWDKILQIYSKVKLPTFLAVDSGSINVLEESINGIIFTYRTWYLAEFMGRTYNFLESILTRESLKHFFWTSDITYKIIHESLNKYEDLKDFLNNCKIKLTENGAIYIWLSDKWDLLRWDIEKYAYLNKENSFINSIVALALLDYFSSKWLVDRKIFNYSMLLQDLSQYRNKTIIWHGIEPINKEVIEEKLKTDDIEWFFKDILESLTGNNILWIDILKDEILKKFLN